MSMWLRIGSSCGSNSVSVCGEPFVGDAMGSTHTIEGGDVLLVEQAEVESQDLVALNALKTLASEDIRMKKI